MLRNKMGHLCATRALKNAKFIRSVAPHVFPAKEPLHGYASIVPFGILRRFHCIKNENLHGHPHLLEAAEKARAEWERHRWGGGTRRTEARLFGASPFAGTLYLVKATFTVGNTTTALSDANMQTVLQYLTLALPQISKYCSVYGENRLAVSDNILQLVANVSSGKYNDDDLQGWVRALVEQLLLSKTEKQPRNVCIVLLNPQGVTNTDGDVSQGIGGYHDKVMVPWLDGAELQEEPSPYCFVNVLGTALTIQDKHDFYADSLSHETAEMTCDPDVSYFNPEVCDGCAGNCKNDWRNFFVDPSPSLVSAYLGSSKTFPPSFPFTYFIASIATREHADDCPAPQSACAYGPPISGAAGDPAGYTWNVDNTEHVVFRGTDGHIHELWLGGAGGGWSYNDLTRAV